MSMTVLVTRAVSAGRSSRHTPPASCPACARRSRAPGSPRRSVPPSRRSGDRLERRRRVRGRIARVERRAECLGVAVLPFERARDEELLPRDFRTLAGEDALEHRLRLGEPARPEVMEAQLGEDPRVPRQACRAEFQLLQGGSGSCWRRERARRRGSPSGPVARVPGISARAGAPLPCRRVRASRRRARRARARWRSSPTRAATPLAPPRVNRGARSPRR